MMPYASAVPGQLKDTAKKTDLPIGRCFWGVSFLCSHQKCWSEFLYKSIECYNKPQ